ncbi:MAG: hypothetical protein ACRCUY_12410, partial [Thermoguttaceae bacterium]
MNVHRFLLFRILFLFALASSVMAELPLPRAGSQNNLPGFSQPPDVPNVFPAIPSPKVGNSAMLP